MASSYRFLGGWRFEAETGELHRADTVIRLEPQPAAMLALLASRAGDLVTHDEIRRAVWGSATHVNFREGMHYCVGQLRRALDDRARDPWLIETIPCRGYRLKVEAVVNDDPPAADDSLPAESPRWSGRLRLTIAGIAAVLAVVVATIERRPNNHHEIAVVVLRTLHDLVY